MLSSKNMKVQEINYKSYSPRRSHLLICHSYMEGQYLFLINLIIFSGESQGALDVC
jgi:hypothetical protein